jgi:4a-hydroxytetrahydrobiopterin dehydratase
MSDQGCRAFLTAEGVADWVVLHGGAMAVFCVSSPPGPTAASVRQARALNRERRHGAAPR